MAKDEPKEKLSTGQPTMDFQLFQVSALVSAIDMARFRMHHLEVTMKGEKAGPYEASQIPPPISSIRAYELLQKIWKSCKGEIPRMEDLLIGVAKSEQEEEEVEAGARPSVTVPGLEDEAFELEEEKREAPGPEESDEVVTLEVAEEEEDEDEGDVVELE